MRAILFVAFVVVFTVVGYAQPALVSKNYNSFNILTSAKNDTTNQTSTVYSSRFSGSAVNGRKIVVGFMVKDTATAGTTTIAPTVDVDLQGSFDGTNFFTVAAAAINDDRFYGSTWATPGFGAVDLSSYTLPYYRLALVPSATLGSASTGSTVNCGEFVWYVAGLN